MRTTRLLPVSPSMHCTLGCTWSRGGVPGPGGLPVPGGYLPGGCTWSRGRGVYRPREYLLDTCFWKYYLVPNFVCRRYLCKGNVFTSEWQGFCPGGECLPLGLGSVYPLSGRHPPMSRPPRHGHCSGRHASYLNAFLSVNIFKILFYLIHQIRQELWKSSPHPTWELFPLTPCSAH